MCLSVRVPWVKACLHGRHKLQKTQQCSNGGCGLLTFKRHLCGLGSLAKCSHCPYCGNDQVGRNQGILKGGSITVPLTSFLTGLESAVLQLTISVFICKTD